MKTLVTGGAGFIGSHIAEALLAQGHEVVVLDDLSRGHERNVPSKARLEKLDINTPAAEAFIAAYVPEAIFHHAAQMDVRVSVKDPVFDSQVNVSGTVRLLHAAATAGTRTFVFASTGGAIYGEQERFPADESHPARAESPYGISKRCGELYLDYFARTRGLRTVALRYANVYGPRQDPHGEAGVVAIFAERMLQNRTPTIFGDGEQTRDYVYVGDVVQANLKALATPTATGAYNIGTGVETSVNTLASAIAKAAHYDGDIVHAEGKPGEQRRSVIDAGRAKRELGWAPTMPLDQGIAATVKYFATKR